MTAGCTSPAIKKHRATGRRQTYVFFQRLSRSNPLPDLSSCLPWNHYCRKQAAYLLAIAEGAEIIVDTDDDNVPKASWAVPTFTGEFDLTEAGGGFVNIYRAFTRTVHLARADSRCLASSMKKAFPRCKKK
ncbi:MAG: hypothetical protein WDN00_00770 [Limisphaerales bacterium]